MSPASALAGDTSKGARADVVARLLDAWPDSVDPIPEESLTIEPLDQSPVVDVVGKPLQNCWLVRNHDTCVRENWRVPVQSKNGAKDAVLVFTGPMRRLVTKLNGTGGVMVMGKLGKKFFVEVSLGTDGRLIVGDRTSASNARMFAVESDVELGRDCMLAGEVTLNSARQHSLVELTPDGPVQIENERKRIALGQHVWLGNRVMVLGDVSIGSGAVVGAGAIVSRSLPANTLALGVPAEVRRENISWSRRADGFDPASEDYLTAACKDLT